MDQESLWTGEYMDQGSIWSRESTWTRRVYSPWEINLPMVVYGPGREYKSLLTCAVKTLLNIIFCKKMRKKETRKNTCENGKNA